MNFLMAPNASQIEQFGTLLQDTGISCHPGEPFYPSRDLEAAPTLEDTNDIIAALHKPRIFNLESVPLDVASDRSLTDIPIKAYLQVQRGKKGQFKWRTIAYPLVKGGQAKYYEQGQIDPEIVKRAKKGTVSDEDHDSLHRTIFAAVQRLVFRANLEFYELLRKLPS